MFTRLQLRLPEVPEVTGDLAEDFRRLREHQYEVRRAMQEYIASLNRPNALALNVRQTTTPTPTSGTGTLTSASSTVECTQLPGGLVAVAARIVIATNGTGATNIAVALPYTAAMNTAAAGHNETAGAGLSGIVTGATMVLVNSDDGSYPGADSTTLSGFSIFQT